MEHTEHPDLQRAIVIAEYVRGSGYGPAGPERWMPGFDGTTFWARGGGADNLTPADAVSPTRCGRRLSTVSTPTRSSWSWAGAGSRSSS